MSRPGSFVVEAKIRMPRIRDEAVIRPRVSDLLRARLDAFDVIWVTATAGAGKTTAVVHALQNADEPVAWMRLDDAEAAPGRLLVYLEHALLTAMPDRKPLVAEALDHGISHAESAALLAESVAGTKATLVIDEVERIEQSDGARDSLSAFIKYAAPGTKVILSSRRKVSLGLARAELDGHIGYVGEDDLAFSTDEAHQALTSLSLSAVDAETAVRATGGWVTGVLFEAWRSAEHVPGAGGEVDPLGSYLSSEIMASLDPDVSAFLVFTAVLDVVTPDRASRIGLGNAGELMRKLRRAHLPVDFDGPFAMRCHMRFREYLLDRWRELDEPVRADITFRHGQLLADEHRHEDAVGEFLAAGDPAQAEDAAEQVILAVARRLDIDLVERWLRSFRPWRVAASPVLTAAELLVAVDREEFGRSARAADRLVASGDQAFLADSRLLGAMAWSYFVNGRVEDAYGVLDGAPKDARTEAIRFSIGVELVDDETHYRDRPADPHTELDGLLARVDLAHGRFVELTTRPDIRQRAVRLAQVGALTGLGRLEEAWERMPASFSGWTGIRMRAELLAECERPQEAWSELIAGREHLAQSESPLYRMFALLTEAMLALRFRRDAAQARAALRAVELEPTALRRVRVLEQIALWKGLIALIEDNADEAVGQLRESVALMTRWDRRLLLPVAAVYLAEAEWRAGEEDASDTAADVAMETARATGSVHVLSRALADFPAVLSRRLDIEKDPDGPWHDLGRTMIVNARSREHVVSRPALNVSELGRPLVCIGGHRREVKLVKSIELLSYLAVEGTDVSRDALIAALFDSKNDKSAQAYLRGAANGIRELVGNPGCLIIDGSRVKWMKGSLTSTFVETRTAYRRLRSVNGMERLRLAMLLIDSVGAREVLPGARSPWVTEHRARWASLILDIRHTAAEAAFSAARYMQAYQLVQDVLREDPYRERAWRLAMKVASAVGDTDQVIAAYRGCEAALAELPTTPSEATRALFERLRC